LRIEDRKDGRIDIVLSDRLEAVAPAPKRAHQGWRYLEAAKEPDANGDESGLAELPPLLYTRLSALALV